jgi:hypothetical protein
MTPSSQHSNEVIRQDGIKHDYEVTYPLGSSLMSQQAFT